MVEFGVNADPRHGYNPADMIDVAVPWVRSVVKPDHDLGPWLRQVRAARGRNLVIIARESLRPDWTFRAAARNYAARYGALVDAWQIGNEADARGPASWTMTPRQLNRLIGAFRAAMPSARLVAAGLVSGNPGYLDAVDIRPVEAIAVHPYGQRPNATFRFGGGWEGWGEVRVLLDAYRRFGKPIWVTEFGGEVGLFDNEHHRAVYHSQIIEALAQAGVPVACVFCWSDGMVPGFGLVDVNGSAKETYAAFYDGVRPAAGVQAAAVSPPRASRRARPPSRRGRGR